MEFKINLPSVITFILGMLIGSGAIWEYQKVEIEKSRLALEISVKTTELRKALSDNQEIIIGITKEFIPLDLCNNKTVESRNKARELHRRLDLAKQNFSVLEKKLAELENRESRKIDLQFSSPCAPKLTLKNIGFSINDKCIDIIHRELDAFNSNTLSGLIFTDDAATGVDCKNSEKQEKLWLFSKVVEKYKIIHKKNHDFEVMYKTIESNKTILAEIYDGALIGKNKGMNLSFDRAGISSVNDAFVRQCHFIKPILLEEKNQHVWAKMSAKSIDEMCMSYPIVLASQGLLLVNRNGTIIGVKQE